MQPITIAEAMDVLRILKQRGWEKALQFFPESKELILKYKDIPHEIAEKEIFALYSKKC
jgi:tRNA A37 threonylcarbamoyladenosine synthetase subunit TsaC/SUA5/YrdC